MLQQHLLNYRQKETTRSLSHNKPTQICNKRSTVSTHRIPTICQYNFEPNHKTILSKDNGERRELSDMTTSKPNEVSHLCCSINSVNFSLIRL